MAGFLQAGLGAIKRISQAKMNPRDAVHGASGDMYYTVQGIRRRFGNLKNYEAKDKINSEKLGILGKVSKGTKSTSVEGTWSATCYLNQSDWRDIMFVYRSTGYMPEISFYIVNDDPTSAAGRNATMYTGVALDEATIDKLDVDDAVLEQELSGSYEDFIPMERFKPIPGMI